MDTVPKKNKKKLALLLRINYIITVAGYFFGDASPFAGGYRVGNPGNKSAKNLVVPLVFLNFVCRYVGVSLWYTGVLMC